jgi:anti-sigma regulatory factor (Ser/Thr protein kinase)
VGDDPGSSIAALLTAAFDRHAITSLRHAVSDRASGAGLAGLRLDGFVLAVNEIMTNAVRHGGGTGELRLWLDNGSLLCEVRDTGAGIASEGFIGYVLPPTTADGGRGLWLARHLCDAVTIDADNGGTTVRLTQAI